MKCLDYRIPFYVAIFCMLLLTYVGGTATKKARAEAEYYRLESQAWHELVICLINRNAP